MTEGGGINAKLGGTTCQIDALGGSTPFQPMPKSAIFQAGNGPGGITGYHLPFSQSTFQRRPSNIQ